MRWRRGDPASRAVTCGGPTGVAVCLALALAADLPARAESDDPAGQPVLDEITVTARKKEVDLQEAPVAVSVISGLDFERASLVKLDNVEGRVPGLMVTKNDGAGRVVSVRGAGWETAQNLSTQPSVLVYLDGVYLANPLALGLHLGEIESIEVLRGPQGTEFGQGTTGGAINVVTRRADLAFTAGELALSVGTYDLLEASASVNLPFGERVAVRASARRHVRDGFSEIRGGALDGYDLDDTDALLGHVSMQWVPTGSLALRLAGFFHDSEQHGAAQKHLDDPNPDPRELTQDFPSRFALDNASLSATVDWDTPWGFELRSLTGVQSLSKRQTVDGDRLTEDLVAVDLTGFGPVNFDLLPFWDNDSRALSQEVNLVARGPRLDWVLGLYYLRHENENFFLEAVGPAPVSQFAEQLAAPSPDTLPPFVPPLEFVEDRTVTREDGAIFAQGVLRLSDRLALTLGGRWQRDRASDETTQFWFFDSRQVLEDQAFTWRLGVDLRLAEHHFLYGLASTGWKNGGNNPGARIGGALDVPPTFRPEEVRALEIGSRNLLARGRARLNATLFFYDYRNYQFIQEDPVPFSAGTGNIPEVEIYGLETEFSWLVSDRLRLDGHLAALDGAIASDLRTLDVADFLASGFGRFTATGVEDRAGLRVNLAGNQPPKLPDLTARLRLSYDHRLGGGSRFTSGLEAVYRGEYQYRVFNHPAVDTVLSYGTLGLFLDYEPAGSPLSLALRATNLLDEAGVNSRFTNPFGLHTTSDELIPPRQIVATIRYGF